MDDQRTSKKRKIFLETLVKCLMGLLDLSAGGRDGKKTKTNFSTLETTRSKEIHPQINLKITSKNSWPNNNQAKADRNLLQNWFCQNYNIRNVPLVAGKGNGK